MFYSEHILTKKGPLAKIWLAAHMHNKLTKAMVFSTNIASAVDRIITPDAPMALRLTSNLLLGVVRIFSRKAKYLLTDSSDALARLKLTYSANVSNDLAENDANPAAITLPGGDHFAGADFSLGDMDFNLASAGFGDSSKPGSRDSGRTQANKASTMTPKYLADARDITIGDYASSMAIDRNTSSAGGAFDMDPDLALLAIDEPEMDRRISGSQAEDEDDAAPLMFTPSQQRTPNVSTPRSSRSVEVMRDAEQPNSDVLHTPRMSFGTPKRNEIGPSGGDGSTRGEIRADTAENPAASLIPFDSGPQPVSPPPQLHITPVDDAGYTTGQPDEPLALPEANLELVLSPGNEPPPGNTTQPGDVPSATQTGDENLTGLSTPPTATVPTPAPQSPTPIAHPAEPAPVSSSRKRRRGAGELPAQLDNETELSADFFRRCLQDTSDIVRPPKRSRVARADPYAPRSASAEDLFSARPAMPFLHLSTQLHEVIDTCFGTSALGLPRVVAPASPMSDLDAELRDIPGVDSTVKQNLSPPLDASKSPVHSKKPVPESPTRGLLEPRSQEVSDVAPSLPMSPIHDAPPSPTPENVDVVVGVSAATPDAPRDSPPELSRDPTGPSQEMSPLPVAEAIPTPIPALRSFSSAVKTGREANPTVTLHEVAATRVEVSRGGSDEGGGEGTVGYGDARLTERAMKMRDFLAENLEDANDGSGEYVAFSSALRKEKSVDRRTAARSFYELLNLCSKRMVGLEQDSAYGDITVRPVRPAFDTAVL